ncbi:MAG: hypothetical protein A3F91_09510 [Flavobacteria bacterium RIFCSPLOWO2_12_FULL_35_11]|nr:MAG: hypothetical protein A3F91_09510 [Flavobacteria bacterium RIFCSPLOWO2_12_FULL_35_11]
MPELSTLNAYRIFLIFFTIAASFSAGFIVSFFSLFQTIAAAGIITTMLTLKQIWLPKKNSNIKKIFGYFLWVTTTVIFITIATSSIIAPFLHWGTK